jgi:O-glycosyl hydrolase
MCQRIVFGLLFLAAFAIHAQDINIHGKVTNSAAAAVSGAVVELVKEGIKDTTRADGTYQITDATGVIAQSLLPQIEKIALVQGVLKLALTKSSPVKVEIFDASGNLLKKEVYQNHEAGYYRLNIAEQVRSSSMLILHASIGKQTKTFRYLPLQNGSYATNSSVEGTASVGGKLAKLAAAVNDTLKVTADGYAVNKTPVTSYNQEVNITLQTEVGDVVAVRLDQEKQTIQGFGVNACLMTGNMFNVDECFGLDGNDALGMSILRIGMDTGGGHRGVPSGWERARTQYNAKIIGSCWSAPGDWKTNGQENDGGHLKEQYYTQWAERIANYAKNNNLYAMSIANEADFSSACAGSPPCTDHYASMTYTGKQMVAFVKEARKAFDKICPNVKLIAPEASLWIHVWSNISPDGTVLPGAPNGGYHSSDPHDCGCFSNEITEEAAAKCSENCKNGGGYDYGHWLAKDEEAWNAIDLLGVHEYESQVAYPWPDDVTGGVRTKEIWQTEMSGVMYWPEQGPSITIDNGVAVARWIQSALMVGEASAWCYWWYGPPYYSSNDNEGLAYIQNNNQKAKRYYTFGNYSRYIRPGHKIVNITGTDNLPEKVLLTASKDDAGKVVIVAVNENASAQSVEIAIAGGTAPASFKSYVTNGNENWKEGSASIAGGVLTMELEKMSVTTFVSQ